MVGLMKNLRFLAEHYMAAALVEDKSVSKAVFSNFYFLCNL